MPKLWNETIEGHRHAVRESTLDATAELVAERGLTGVTMSQVAERAGIGRATLYKYFPDLESILSAWHERHVSGHLEHLAHARDHAPDPAGRLEAVLTAFAFHSHHSQEGDLAARLHSGPHMDRAQQHLHTFVRDLVAEGVDRGELRDDVPPEELAAYCLHALTAAGGAPSMEAVGRLVTVTLSGLRPN